MTINNNNQIITLRIVFPIENVSIVKVKSLKIVKQEIQYITKFNIQNGIVSMLYERPQIKSL